jgi:NAD(P)-dependent dehydrogenase (short-subunit alcohol dehydrogenase family)
MQIRGTGALVAGGASGLGEAVARRLHGGGAHIVIADLNADKGQSLGGELATAAMLGNQPGDSGERGVCVNTASVAIESEMLNGEVIRLDGALRMPPK